MDLWGKMLAVQQEHDDKIVSNVQQMQTDADSAVRNLQTLLARVHALSCEQQAAVSAAATSERVRLGGGLPPAGRKAAARLDAWAYRCQAGQRLCPMHQPSRDSAGWAWCLRRWTCAARARARTRTAAGPLCRRSCHMAPRKAPSLSRTSSWR